MPVVEKEVSSLGEPRHVLQVEAPFVFSRHRKICTHVWVLHTRSWFKICAESINIVCASHVYCFQRPCAGYL